MFNTEFLKKEFSQIEEEILEFWLSQEIFKQSLENRKNAPIFTFYDGPPFATGLPHYGHMVAGTLKDVIPRYQTMKGRYVPRVFGWDCHGLPVEYEMEKELGLKGRKDIEDYGIKNFCESCRGIVLRYTAEWEKTVNRMGRWVDFKNGYRTMDPNYMESILWVFKSLYDKGLIYEGHKAMHVCPRCATTLSNFEVSMGYRDINDVSVVAKFPVADEKDTYFLAWTTTPWTLPANMLLAVGAEVEYVKVKTRYDFETDEKRENKDVRLNYEQKASALKSEAYIIAKDLMKKFGGVLGETPEILATYKGSDLVGMRYEPLFLSSVVPAQAGTSLSADMAQPNGKNSTVSTAEQPPAQHQARAEKLHSVVAADFVSTEDGTGIVHIAPAFGEDDLKVGQKEGVPIFQPLDITGTFTAEAPEFLRGKEARASNKEIVKYLDEKNRIFESKQFSHSYPHCWRCDSALLNYATSSFFVDVNKIKEKMVAANQKIHWVPEHLQGGRFGKWLEGAKDWAISRNRFWGAPIPVWKCEKCHKTAVAASIRDIAAKAVKKSKILVVRHGEGEHNVQDLIISKIDAVCPLTTKGRAQAQKMGADLKNEKIDLIFASPLQRTRETAEEIAKALGKDVSVQYDERLKEIDAGTMEGKTLEEWYAQFKNPQERYYENPHGGETKADVERRAQEFLQEIFKNHRHKNILIITHGAVLRVITKFFHNLNIEETLEYPVEIGKINEFSFDALPVNENGEMDLHRPYIDAVKIACDCGGEMSRVSDVLDCWFESGSMPYAERHYPFEQKAVFEKGFPADFIAEGLDQTRGWFYTLHVLASGLFGTEAFKNVIVNGIVLAEDGQKMSKSKKNYPDPELIFKGYGADAMRFYLMNSPVVRADDLRFSEQGVAETVRRVLLPLKNSYAFFAQLANVSKWSLKGEKSTNKLDQWILAELRECAKSVTEALDDYKIDLAAREIPEFLDKLTNFYIRRSKRRFWDEENAAFETLWQVLIAVCKMLAPFAPFFAEAVYRELITITPSAPKSIHLCDWVDYKEFADNPILRAEIGAVRSIVSLGLGIRAQKKIRVRQPLHKATIALPPRVAKEVIFANEELIREELNVHEIEILDNPEDIAKKIAKPDARKIGPRLGKEVQTVINEAKNGNFQELPDGKIQVGEYVLAPEEVEICYLAKEGFDVLSDAGIVVALDTRITEVLREEGIMREIVRHLQDMRREADYQIADRIMVSIGGAPVVLEKYGERIAGEVLALNISEKLEKFDLEKEVEIDGEKVVLAVKKS